MIKRLEKWIKDIKATYECKKCNYKSHSIIAFIHHSKKSHKTKGFNSMELSFVFRNLWLVKIVKFCISIVLIPFMLWVEAVYRKLGE